MQKISALTGILIIVAAAIILFGGVFAWQHYVKSQIPITNDQPNPNSSISQKETADWKTYKNDIYPISFNYPQNWVVEKRFSDRSSLPEGLDGFTVYLESNKLDAIHIDATERWCDDLSESGFKCVPIGPHLVYTISKNEVALEVFNKIVSTLKFTK